MFCCTFDKYQGFGETPGDAFDNMLFNINISPEEDFAEGIEPHDCRFWAEVEVEIQESKSWVIEEVME